MVGIALSYNMYNESVKLCKTSTNHINLQFGGTSAQQKLGGTVLANGHDSRMFTIKSPKFVLSRRNHADDPDVLEF